MSHHVQSSSKGLLWPRENEVNARAIADEDLANPQNIPLGNCAAVAWSPGSAASPAAPDLSAAAASTEPVQVATTITSIIDKTHTTTHTTSPRQDALPSTRAVSPSSSASSQRAAPTLQGFSGENGPGGRAEQNLHFGYGNGHGTVTGIIGLSGSSSSVHASTVYTPLAVGMSTMIAAYFAA